MEQTGRYNVEFIREDVPKFDIPVYEGDRYEVMVPDTLDIQERIKLAVNGLTGPTDPEKDYLLYFSTEFRANPPRLKHSKSDICQIKNMESLPLMRLASGTDLNDQVDPVWMTTALRMIGPDGLAYWPSLPWGRYPCWAEPCDPNGKHYAVPFMNGRLIGAMTAYMLRDLNGPWDAEIRKIVDGLTNAAVFKDDYAYFPHGGFLPDQPRLKDAEIPVGIFASLVGWTIQGLAQYHRVSHYEPAEELAGRLSRYVVSHGRYFGPNGEFLPNNTGNESLNEKTFHKGPPPVSHRIHFQHHAVPLLGVLDHALSVKDDELTDFVNKSFLWARSKGHTLLGYFPENIDNVDELETSETCEVAGMIGLALKLSAAGIGDYWDDADRWIRNQFAENQLLQSDWIYHMFEGGVVPSRARSPLTQIDPMSMSADRAPERSVGGFAGWPSVNDWYIGHGTGIMQCCTGNGSRGLYYVWEHMLGFEEGILSVNLLMNRASKWADVHSHVPYTGRVDVNVKTDLKKIRLRIPEWVKPEEVEASVNGKPAKPAWEGRYAVLGQMKAQDIISLKFPISERKVELDVEKQTYHVTFKGNEVVDVYPRGRFCPLYQRNHYRGENTRWKLASRFVSNKEIYW